MARRIAAGVALLSGAAGLLLAAAVIARDFPTAVPVVACVVGAAVAAGLAIVRRGIARAAGLTTAAILAAAAVVLILTGGRGVESLIVTACFAVALSSARLAFAAPAELPRADPPHAPVLCFNPKSGGGKATRFRLADEARARGIEPIELRPGDDLEEIVSAAVARGADALAMAGGDGSQAIVARLASERGLPYACIPAGTRNHFALDLGVDRDDVVGALDAFVDGGERRVDLAEVNGRVFVNNVSLGLYADAVQLPGYRDAKLRTILGTLPEVLGPNGGDEDGMRWPGPDGREEGAAGAVLVSNNAYRLGRAIGSGTRPHVDEGVLGVAVLDRPGTNARRRPWREWTVDDFEVTAGHAVNAGIDGEAVVLDPPLRFAIRPGVLRVRIARQHPGASPSAAVPDSPWAGLRVLARIAAGDARA
jgi:diacylglycerol kinase family enzyme